jgi:N-acetylglucosamine kinase-like BadF-type ATPase
MKHLYLGIDGGQSSTTALIGEGEGRVVGMGRGGPCNHVKTSEGRERFTGAIRDCLELACKSAGLDPAGVRFEAFCGGFSGGPEDKQRLLGEMIRADRVRVENDAYIALAGANLGGPAIITIAGTGSIALGRSAAGRVARAGGWGYIFGDEGSGFDITRQALRAALRYEEGWGPETQLREGLLSATGAANVNELMHSFYTPEYPRACVAGFARLVDEIASAGDLVARNLLLNAAQELATLAGAVRGQLFEAGDPVFVVYIGGVFRSELVRERYRMLIELEEGNTCGTPKNGPAAGALIEAYRLAGVERIPVNLPEYEK